MSKVAIIGSGIGGLTAGNLLAGKGHQVTIFESHTTPGGYTAGFWRNGFYFESGTLSFETSKMIFGAMKDLGLLDQVAFTRLHTRWVNKELDCSTESYDEFKQALFSAYPEETPHLQRYFAAVDKMYYATLPFIKNEKRPLPFLLLTFLISGVKMAGLFRKYVGVTLGEFTGRFFEKDSKLYRFLGSIGYPEMAAYILGGTFATVFDDYWTVAEGMQSWADLLSDNFKNLGGELKLNSYVDRIITKNHTAIAVSCKQQIYPADYVIAAGDYKKTFLKLLDDPSVVPAEFLAKVEKTPVSEGVVTAYLGLSLPNERLQEYLKLPHLYYLEDEAGAELRDPLDRDYFKKTGITLYSPSLLNKKLAPEGKSSLMIQSFAPTGWMNNWGGGDKELYQKLKKEVLAALTDKALNIIAGLHEHVEFADLATPLTYERYTHNTGGATSAWSWNPQNKFHKSFMKSHVETPVNNLYIGSCWSMQIGGVPGAVGAAYECAKRIK